MTEQKEHFHWLNDASKDMLYKGYLEPNTTPQERVWEICQSAERILGIDGFARKLYDYKARGFYSWSSPVWSNFGNDRGMPISCFNSNIEDSTGSLLFAASEIGTMSKLGGGTSAYFGNVRPRGSKIGHSNGTSNGAVSFMQLYEGVTDTISQGGVRRGRVAAYLPIEHGDFYEFMDSIGVDGAPIQNITHAVTVTDEFMKRLEDRDSDAMKRWAKVIQTRDSIGYPYVMYVDTANNNTVDVYKDNGYKIKSSNLCVAPETNILTDRGYKRISDLAGESVSIWNGEEWSTVDVFKTGENQKLVTVTLNSGQHLDCTLYHKFYVQNGYGTKNVVEKRACDLSEGDKIVNFTRPVINGSEVLEKAYQNGFYSGDGCEVNGNARVYLYGEKRKLTSLFTEKSMECIQDDHDREYFNVANLKNKFFVPDSSYTLESRCEWFAGLIDSDGTRTINNGTQSIQIASINPTFMRQTQAMLDTMGVESKVVQTKNSGFYDLPASDGTGGTKRYFCKNVERLLIGESGVQQLLSLGMETYRITFEKRSPNRMATHFSKVVSVEDHGRVDDTYCFTEEKRNMGVFNGILTGQCIEIMLPSTIDESFVCCVSSMNVAEYDQWKDTDAVETMVLFMDAVLTDFITKMEKIDDPDLKYFMKRAVKFAKRHRAIGIGTLGWHTYLQQHMIPFESAEAYELNVDIHQTINERAWEASKQMAKTHGEPDVLKGYGRRHTTLTAIAPTRSSSVIAGGVSQSIEPLTSNVFPRDTAKGKIIVKNSELARVLESYGRNDRDTWNSIKKKDGSVQHLSFLSDHEKKVFKTYSELDQNAIIEQAAMRQKYVDQGQSLNLFIHPSTPTKVTNAFMIKAWKMGIKGLYYQYSKSAAVSAGQEIEENCPTCEA